MSRVKLFEEIRREGASIRRLAETHGVYRRTVTTKMGSTSSTAWDTPHVTGLTEQRRISRLPRPRSIAAVLAVFWLAACQPAPAHTWIVVPPDTIDCGVDDQIGPPGEGHPTQ